MNLIKFNLTILFLSQLISGEIDNNFSIKLNQLSALDTIEAMISLKEQADIISLKKIFDQQNLPRIERHRLIIEELQQISDYTQTYLLDYLNQRIIDGQVIEYKNYWISNCL